MIKRSVISSNTNYIFKIAISTINTQAIRCFSSLKDEYGAMNSNGEIFESNNFILECGEALTKVKIVYRTYGTINRDKSNVMV